MKMLIYGLEAISNVFEKIVKLLLIILMLALCIVILYGIFMRYVVNKSPSWTEELGRYLMVWSALLGMGLAMKLKKHVGLTSFVGQIWKKHTQKAFLVSYLLIVLFLTVVLVSGISMTIFVAKQHAPSSNMPMWIPYMSIPVGAFFMLWETVIIFLKELTGTHVKEGGE